MEVKPEVEKEKQDQPKEDPKVQPDQKEQEQKVQNDPKEQEQKAADEQADKYEKRFIEFDDKLKDLEKRIIEMSKAQAEEIEKQKKAKENPNRELIGYGYEN